MSVRGIFSAHSGISGDKVGDFSSKILLTQPQGTAPLLALSSGMPNTPAKDTTFSWIEDGHINGSTTAAADALIGATTVVVDDSNLWVPNTLILNVDTDEVMLITAIAGNSLTVVRGIGSAAVAVTDGDVLHNIGTAYGEATGKPDAITQRGESRSNHVQIFKNGWAISGTAKAISYLTGSQLAKNKADCASYHAEDMEKAFLFGKKAFTTIGNRAVFVSDGVYSQIKKYGGLVYPAAVGGAGGLNLVTLRQKMRQIFDINVKGAANERIAFCSSTVLELLNEMARLDSSVEMKEVSGDTFGLQIFRFVGTNGTLKMMSHPLLGTLGYHDILILHPSFIQKRTLRSTMSEEFNTTKNTSNGVDADEGYLLTQLGFEVGAAKTMGLITGITTAVASSA